MTGSAHNSPMTSPPRPNKMILGVGEMAVSATPGDVIKIIGLGSCVGLVMIDSRNRCIGLAHVALPDSKLTLDGTGNLPGRYADTAVDAMIRDMHQAGADRNQRRYTVKLVGGANFSGPADFFTIGKRNVLALKKALWQHGMGAVAEDIGGHRSRCVAVDVDTCTVWVYGPRQEGRAL